MRITDIEPMCNMHEASKDFGKPFGIKLIYADGSSHRTSFENALCASLSKRQRAFVETIIKSANNKEQDDES